MQLPLRVQPFPESGLEMRYRQWFRERHRCANQAAALAALLVYAAFAVVDLGAGGERWQTLWIIRLGLTVPLLAALTAGFAVPRLALRHPEGLGFGFVLVAGLGALILYTQVPSPARDLYFTGVVLVMSFGPAGLRADPRWTAGAALLVLAAYPVALWLAPVPWPHALASVLYALGALALGVSVGQWLERNERQGFLLEQRLQRLAKTDPLTGLPNRRAFLAHLESEWRRALRAGTPLALLVFDVDRLQAINEALGDTAGDRALKRLAAVLKGHARRPGDLAARIGGDEFALLLSGSSEARARELAAEVAAGFGSLPQPGTRRAVSLTASAGAATTVPTPDQRPQLLMTHAHAALAQARAMGRGRAAHKTLGGDADAA